MKELIIALEAKIQEHQALYDTGEPSISDAEFDRMVTRLRQLAPKSSVLDGLGKAVSTRKSKHASAMLSLEKAADVKAVLAWAKKSPDAAFVLAPKYDGLALSLTYKQGGLVSAVTRGDGVQGDEVLSNAKHVPSIPQQLRGPFPPSIIVRGEVLFPRSAELPPEAANARNLAAGTMLRKTPNVEVLKQLSFIAYDVIDEARSLALTALSGSLEFADRWGFDVGDLVFSEGAADLLDDVGRATPAWSAADYAYECDGLVAKVDKYSLREKLGATSHHPRWAIALKFASDKATTKLKGIEWQVSRTGVITPVAIVEPVRLSGAMVTRATLHNLDQMRKLGPFWRVGDTVEMCRRGGVIPHVERIVSGSTGETLVHPKVCPSCGEVAYEQGGQLFCLERESCPGVQIGIMRHWCSTLDMLGWGDEVLKQLYESGVIDRESLYSTVCDEALLSLGKTIGRKLIKERSTKSKCAPAVFLAALGLPGIGRSQAEKLLARFGDVQAIIKLTAEDHDRLRAELTPALFNNLTTLHEAEALALLACVELVVTAKISGPWDGLSFVFTGKLTDMEREEARDAVRALGGSAPDSVTKGLTYLVVGDLAREEQRTKRDKAEKYNASGSNIQVIEEEAFVAMLAQAYAQ